MFDRSAELYDALYDALGKDYRIEAEGVLGRIQRLRGSEPTTLLDVACGTGRHLQYFSDRALCTGVDIEQGLLSLAQHRCPEVRFVHADMIDFNLNEQFEAVTCLFSSIGYVRDALSLRRAVATMAAHVAPGGVLVVEPWFAPDQWHEGTIQVIEADLDNGRVVRMMRSSREADTSVLDAHYLVGDAMGMTHMKERHELGLFRRDEYLLAFEETGLDTTAEERGLTGRGLILGIRR